MIRPLMLTCAMALAAALPARAETLVVDPFLGPGAEYVQIYEAVDAAADGDTILVREGSGYIRFTVDGKGLTIVADTEAIVWLTGSIEVRNLGPTQSVLLRGLNVTTVDSGVGLRVEDCDGPVWVEDCGLFPPYLTQAPVHGCEVRDSSFVSFTRTSSEGSRALQEGGGHGLLVEDATVSAHDCHFLGGFGNNLLGNDLEAGHGAVVESGYLFASGSTLEGGEGGMGSSPFGCDDGGDGGVGLMLMGSAPLARLVESNAQGGAAGASLPPCGPGAPGPDTQVLAGTLDPEATSARSLDMNGTVRAGDTAVVDFRGEPGDVIWWMLSLHQAPLVLPGGVHKVGGPILLDPGASLTAVVGPLDATGTAQLGTVVPPVPVSGTLYSQALHFGTDGTIILSSGATLTLIEDTL